MTVTPGIAAALRRRSVSSHPSGVPCGRTKTATAVALPCRRAIVIASSPIVARVQGHFGCPMTTMVGRPATRGMWLFAGHRAGDCPSSPGVVSYFRSTAIPPATTANHTTPMPSHNRLRDFPASFMGLIRLVLFVAEIIGDGLQQLGVFERLVQ